MKNSFYRKGKILVCFAFTFIVVSCTSEWLDIKSDKKLVVPSSLKDLQALVDNPRVLVTGTPAMAELSADNYVLSTESFKSLRENMERNIHIWARDIYEDATVRGVPTDWSMMYEKVYYANLTIEGLEKLKDLSQAEADWKGQVMGQALFVRAWAYFHLLQVFSPHYNAETATADLSIPMRLYSDISKKSVQVTVQEAYEQLIGDLERAAELLPSETELRLRPVKAAAEGLLSRTYLIMGNYELALAYADRSLAWNSELLDFNNLDSTANYAIAQYNKEVVYRATQNSSQIMSSAYEVNESLYELYEDGDLRLPVFYKYNNGLLRFHGSYEGSGTLFTGISTNEMILIRSECFARLGDRESAVFDLKNLLEKRYRPDDFEKIVFEGDLLEMILLERRKELPFRGIRWFDLRRLNASEEHQVTLTREIDGQRYELKPNDPRYTLPFPDIVVEQNKFVQNKR